MINFKEVKSRAGISENFSEIPALRHVKDGLEAANAGTGMCRGSILRYEAHILRPILSGIFISERYLLTVRREI